MNEDAFLKLIAGHGGPMWRRLLRVGLRVLSGGYGLGMRLRNAMFDAGLRRVHDATVPVVSVGNLTTGGTGKTPMVALLVQLLQERGGRPGIVSRGYRSLLEEGNDERRVLEILCPGVPHVQKRDRVAAARDVVAGSACDVIVADDAFQHRRLGRSLDVVLIDGLNPFGFEALLPRGLLREPVSGLRRADLVVLTRADQTPALEREAIWQQVRRWKPELVPVEVAFDPSGFVNLAGSSVSIATVSGPVVAFCGIGNPVAFERTLRAAGVVVAELRTFPDHYEYAAVDLTALAESARRLESGTLVTTLKDLVKLREIAPPGVRLLALEIRARIVTGEDFFRTRLMASVAAECRNS